MTDLDIKVSQMQGNKPVTVLHVTGDIDAKSHEVLDAKATDIINGGARHVLLDLTNIKYMSSAGFRSMHKIYTILNANDDDSACLKILKPSEQIKRLMKTMGFDSHMPAFDDLTEAVNSF